MNATYTVHYEHAELEALAEHAKRLSAAAGTAAKLLAAPLLGLAFVMAPVVGLAYLMWMAAKVVIENAVVKRIALFAAAPLVALVYAVAFPFVGIGALAYYGARAALS